jgi:hypothetical protein
LSSNRKAVSLFLRPQGNLYARNWLEVPADWALHGDLLGRRKQARYGSSGLTFSRAQHERIARRGMNATKPRHEVPVADLPLAALGLRIGGTGR